MTKHLNFLIILLTHLILPVIISAQVKETHQIIEEWIETKQLISEEKHLWKVEKAALIDLEDALNLEIGDLEKKLKQFKNENIGIAKQRIDLNRRQEKAQNSSADFYKGIQKVEKEIKGFLKLLPKPLKDRISVFYEKIDTAKTDSLPLKERLDSVIGLLQSVHIFHRSVHLVRQEFIFEDEKSREFLVIYFGLGAAYFVNESGNVAGWGKPTQDGWEWIRDDRLAKEISTGVAMIENRTLPRFLKLPVPLGLE